MKVAVIGAGAVGGYFGGRLAASGSEVVFLVRGKTLDALRTRPLRVQSIGGDFEVSVRATDDPAEVGEVEAVLVAVKAWQVREAAAAIRKMPGEESIVVPLQNGMDAPAELAACSMGGLTPMPASRSTTAPKRAICRPVWVDCSSSATAKWVHTPSRNSSGRDVTSIARFTASPAEAPPRSPTER